jgi:hypothetical protein
VLDGVAQIGEWLDALGTAHCMSSLRSKGKEMSSLRRNPIMESALTICVKAGIGRDFHHLSDMLDTCELRSLIEHIFQVIVKETAHTERLVVSLISPSVC